MRRMFAVGRVDRKTTEVRVVEHRAVQHRAMERARDPFPSGPFTLAAVVRSTGAVIRVER